MKYFQLIIIVLIMVLNVSYAKSAEDTSSDWDSNSSVFNTGFEDQEAVSDTKLKKAIEAIKQNSLSRKQKRIQNEVKPLAPMSDFDHLSKFTRSQSPDDELSQTLTVMIPVAAYSPEGKTIQPGYYKLSCRKVAKNEYVLDLSQGSHTVLTVKAEQTNQDLEQDTISFCNSEIISNNRIRLMYGSIDLNLVGYLYFD